MAFITLHQENGLCGYEASLINPEQIAAITPVVGDNKWFVQRTNACLRLNDGSRINVRETVSAIMGILQESVKLREISGAVSEIANAARELQAQTA